MSGLSATMPISSYWSALSAVAKTESSISPVYSSRSMDVSPSSSKRESRTPKVEGEVSRRDRSKEAHELLEKCKTLDTGSDNLKKSHHKRSESGSQLGSPTKSRSLQTTSGPNMGHKEVNGVSPRTNGSVNGESATHKKTENSPDRTRGVKLPNRSEASVLSSPEKKTAKKQGNTESRSVDSDKVSVMKCESSSRSQEAALCLSTKQSTGTGTDNVRKSDSSKSHTSSSSSNSSSSALTVDVHTLSITTTTTATTTVSMNSTTTVAASTTTSLSPASQSKASPTATHTIGKHFKLKDCNQLVLFMQYIL